MKQKKNHKNEKTIVPMQVIVSTFIDQYLSVRLGHQSGCEVNGFSDAEIILSRAPRVDQAAINVSWEREKNGKY